MAKKINYHERNKVVQAWYESGLSQEKYAQKIGMSSATLNSWTRKYSDETGENLVVKRNNEQKSRWFSVIEDWRDSCMSQENYAKEYGIELDELKKWIKVYEKELCVKIEKVNYKKMEWFAEVEEWIESQKTFEEYVDSENLDKTEFKKWCAKYEKEKNVKLLYHYKKIVKKKEDKKEDYYLLIDSWEQKRNEISDFVESIGVPYHRFMTWKKEYEREYGVYLKTEEDPKRLTWEERFDIIEEWEALVFGRKRYLKKKGVSDIDFRYWVARYEDLKGPLENKEISLFDSFKIYIGKRNTMLRE